MSWVDVLGNIPTNAVLRQKLETLQAEFEALERRIADLEKENAELRAQIPTGEPEFNDIEIAILELLGRAGNYVHKDRFAAQLGIPAAKAEYYLRSLDQSGYLTNSINMNTGISYKLSQKGSGFLIDTGRL